MTILIVNEQVRSLFSEVRENTEIRDAQGNFLGLFVPAPKIIAPVAGRKTYTTLEMFEHWKTLTDDPVRLADLDMHIKELKATDEADARDRSLERRA